METEETPTREQDRIYCPNCGMRLTDGGFCPICDVKDNKED